MPDRGPSRPLRPERAHCTTLKYFHRAKLDFRQTEARVITNRTDRSRRVTVDTRTDTL